MEELTNAIKKVRIIYNDPDATDSDSDCNEDGIKNVLGTKRVVKEVVIQNVSGRNNCLRHLDNVKEMDVNEKMQGLKICDDNKRKRSSSIYRGVRKRKWGKFAAEIRNPFIKGQRLWLGTYDSEKEAALVYQAKKLEFDRLIMLEKTNNNVDSSGSLSGESSGCVRSSSSSETNGLCSLPSPSSVLDVSTSAPLAQVPGDLGKDSKRKKEPKEKRKTADSYRSLSRIMEDFISQEHQPVEDDLLLCSNTDEQSISELIREPPEHLNPLKEIEEWQPFREDRSPLTIPRKESILRTMSHLQFGSNIEVPEIIAGPIVSPPTSPSIWAELYFEENLKNGNDLQQLGLEDKDLSYSHIWEEELAEIFNEQQELEEVFSDQNGDAPPDLPKICQLYGGIEWIDEVLLLENEV